MGRLKDRLQWNVVSFSRIDDVFSFPWCWNDSIANFVPETSSLGVSGQSASLNIKIFMICDFNLFDTIVWWTQNMLRPILDRNRRVDMQKRDGLSHQVSVVVVGCGQRGSNYAAFALDFPSRWRAKLLQDLYNLKFFLNTQDESCSCGRTCWTQKKKVST